MTVKWLRRVRCWTRRDGHEYLHQFESGRWFLRCAHCDHETDGWEVGGGRLRRRFVRDVPEAE